MCSPTTVILRGWVKGARVCLVSVTSSENVPCPTQPTRLERHAMEERRRSPLERYRSDLLSVVGAAATAYGYTLTIWSTGMILSHTYGPPNPPEVPFFFVGAVAVFAVVGTLAFGGMSWEFVTS